MGSENFILCVLMIFFIWCCSDLIRVLCLRVIFLICRLGLNLNCFLILFVSVLRF